MLDHDTDSYQKISRAVLDGHPAGGLTRDHILDNISLYWLTGSATSAARMYWESGRSTRRGGAVRRARGFAAGRLHGVPRMRFTRRHAKLGRAGVPQPQLLPRSRSRRSLRGVGGAATLHRGAPVPLSGRSVSESRGDAYVHQPRVLGGPLPRGMRILAVRPFHVDIAEEAVTDPRRRIAAWRPPEREPVDDQSQGVRLATVQDLANYWATEYDWRVRSAAERAAAVQDRDRRPRRPFHPRPVR